ncbi:hypothetical protein [Alteromonas ponticola]|uniref:TnsA endonuclease N-terminal domain-containing protein n=1 Tax=Alteromonas ponticola TaxID=2720613 RepID=A0ABX1R6Z9_9ALTE|nr:hypothetical protein [Alteromonas ponticola]NMH61000.1 hypothetical protein [Alteromonas ponticola]
MKSKTNIHSRTTVSKKMYRSSSIMISGRFACNKNENQLLFQSYLELGVLRTFALDPSITFMDTQRGTMKWRPSNSKALRTYTPDVVSINGDGEITFTEVKPKAKLVKNEVTRLSEIKDSFNNAGYAFEVITDEEVPYEVFVNTGQLLSADISHYEPGFLQTIVDSLSTIFPDNFTFGQLEQALTLYGFPICHYGLIKAGYFTFDMKKLLEPSSPIWRAS